MGVCQAVGLTKNSIEDKTEFELALRQYHNDKQKKREYLCAKINKGTKSCKPTFVALMKRKECENIAFFTDNYEDAAETINDDLMTIYSEL